MNSYFNIGSQDEQLALNVREALLANASKPDFHAPTVVDWEIYKFFKWNLSPTEARRTNLSQPALSYGQQITAVPQYGNAEKVGATQLTAFFLAQNKDILDRDYTQEHELAQEMSSVENKSTLGFMLDRTIQAAKDFKLSDVLIPVGAIVALTIFGIVTLKK